MEALLVSAGVVALAEMGDKTQLLSLLLAAKFRKLFFFGPPPRPRVAASKTVAKFRVGGGRSHAYRNVR